VARPNPSPADLPYIVARAGGTTASQGDSRPQPAGHDDDALDRLADGIADRLAARLGGLMPEQPEALVDAAEIARIYGKTRSWVYEHAGELGAIRLGSGQRPRLGFSLRRVAERLEKVDRPPPQPQPESPRLRRRRQLAGRTATGAPLLHVRSAKR